MSSKSCSFCLRSEAEVRKLVAGPGVLICDQCVALAASILESDPGRDTSGPPPRGAIVPWGELSDDDMLTRLPRMGAVSRQVDRALQEWVDELRRRRVTWDRIGAALAITRQSAWTRFNAAAAPDAPAS
jgi:hypothetical protein